MVSHGGLHSIPHPPRRHAEAWPRAPAEDHRQEEAQAPLAEDHGGRRPAARHHRARHGRRRHLRALAQPALAGGSAQASQRRQHDHLRPSRRPHRRVARGREPRAGDEQGDPRGHEAGHRGYGGRALLHAPRRGFSGRRARRCGEHPCRRRRAGRLHDHRAVRQECLRWQRAHLYAQAPRSGAGLAARGPVVQGQDPHGIPQHRVLRRGCLRRGAAALTYFHKHASGLNLQQAALLAALPKFPTEYSPTTDPKLAKERRNLVLQVMADQGYITQQRAIKASKKKIGVYPHPPSMNNDMADYFTAYVTGVLTKRYGTRQVFEGGLKVYTSIDMTWQREAIDVIKSTTGPLNFGFKPAAALVAIDPKNGYIRTMVGGLDFKKRSFNLATQAKRQPGSAMKPFVLTTAVQQGMNPDTTYYNSHSPVIIPMGAYATPWVVNGDGPGGPESVSAATTISDNVVFAQLSIDVGPQNTVETARKMGITSPLDAVPSITLGTSVVTPLEMADGYATLASGGIHHPPQAIVKVEFPDGRVDWKPKTKGHRAIPAGVASVVTQCLERVATSGTGSSTVSWFPYTRAGKTGTTDKGWDVWYVGYTPQLVASVWMGDAVKNSPMSGAYGGTYCAPMWAKFFAAALKDQPHPSFVTVPWTFGPWHGKMQAMSPSASPSASGSASPSPGPTKTIKPTVTPKPTPTKAIKPTATPRPTPTETPTQKIGLTAAVAMAVTSTTGDGSKGLAGKAAGWLSLI